MGEHLKVLARRYIMPLKVTFLGVLLSLAVFCLLLERDRRVIELKFEREAENYFVLGVGFLITFLLAIYLASVVQKDDFEQKVAERTGQLIEAQQELIRNEKQTMLGLIAGGMGNELRNPLGVMNNAVFYLKNIMPDADGTVREYLDIIKQEIDNSRQIISELHDFTCLKPSRSESVSVSDLVRQSLEKCAIPENISVELQLSETLPSVRADSYQIGQVLQNIISNAVQAMAGGGKLTIMGEGGIQRVQISVSDTGEGIAPENREKIFEPLFSTRSRGIGLGLALSKRYVETNGGSIGVESELGQGTTFSIRLPIEKTI